MTDLDLGSQRDLVELSLEAEWPRLKAQLEIVDGSWLVFAFCSSREQSRELLSRAQWQLRARGSDAVVVPAGDAGAVRALVTTLLETEPPGSSVTWVDGVAVGQVRRATLDAWEQFALRANDHRDAVLRRHRHGLVLCLARDLKPMVREAAPDLWAKRVLTLEVDPPVSLHAPRVTTLPSPVALMDERLTVARPFDPRAASRDHRGSGRALSGARTLLAAGEHARVAEALEDLLRGELPEDRRGQALIELAGAREAGGDPPGAIVAVESALAGGGLTLPQLERAAVQLDRLAAEADRPELAAAAAGALVALRRTDDPPALADALLDLATRQRAVGQLERARASAQEAADIHRQLATDDPERHLPNLATSLNNLSNRQSAVGDRAGALESITEAVTLRRALAQASPQAFVPDLAMSLNNLSVQESNAGDRAGALESITEAVTLRRALAQGSPQAFLPDLARSLHILSIRLGETGDRAGALESITEAVTLRRALAEGSPQAFLPDLARSLHNLSIRLGDTGDRAAAVATVADAVELWRSLAEASPQAFLPDLAGSLNNQAMLLDGAGRSEEGLAGAEEAVAIRRALVEADPAAHLPALATAVGTLAGLLRSVGRSQEGVVAAEEAEQIGRRLRQSGAAGG